MIFIMKDIIITCRADSVDYHFNKHANDGGVNVRNIPDYLNKALKFENEVEEAKKNLRELYQQYKVVDCSSEKGVKGAKKYTHKYNKKFIMLAPYGEIIYFCGK